MQLILVADGWLVGTDWATLDGAHSSGTWWQSRCSWHASTAERPAIDHVCGPVGSRRNHPGKRERSPRQISFCEFTGINDEVEAAMLGLLPGREPDPTLGTGSGNEPQRVQLVELWISDQGSTSHWRLALFPALSTVPSARRPRL